MEKNKYGNRYLALVILSSVLIVPNATFASESAHSNRLTWAGIGTALGMGAVAYRIYSHRRDVSGRIEKVSEDYDNTKTLKPLTITDHYEGDRAKDDIIRDFNNGSIAIGFRSVMKPGMPSRVLLQWQFPAILMLRSGQTEFDDINKQVQKINRYRYPYHDRLKRDYENEQNQQEDALQVVEGVGCSWYQQWVKPVVDCAKWVTVSLSRFILYPADDIVCNDDFVKDWKRKTDCFLSVKHTLNENAEEINRRCTYRS